MGYSYVELSTTERLAFIENRVYPPLPGTAAQLGLIRGTVAATRTIPLRRQNAVTRIEEPILIKDGGASRKRSYNTTTGKVQIAAVQPKLSDYRITKPPWSTPLKSFKKPRILVADTPSESQDEFDLVKERKRFELEISDSENEEVTIYYV